MASADRHVLEIRRKEMTMEPRLNPFTASPDKILIIGGGFAGFWAAVAARRVAGSRARVTLVAPEPMLEVRPRLYEARPETLAVALLPLLRKVDVGFVRGEAIGLETAARAVTLATGERLAYDRLVVATGSRMRRPPVPGAETAFSVDTQAEAIAFDRRLREIARAVAEPTIAVVGSGFTGIELALELRDRLLAHVPAKWTPVRRQEHAPMKESRACSDSTGTEHALAHGADAAAERLRVVLIDRSEVVGRVLGPGPRREIQAAMAAAGVELRLGATVRALAADRVSFADGSVLAADAVVLATGMAAAPFAAQVPGARDELGRVVVDTLLRAPGAPAVFVADDAAAADTGDGHRTLQSCQHAGQLGRVAGENAASDLLGLPLMPYSQLRYVTCLDLGRSGAVITQGWERRVEKTGSEGKAVKRLINTQLIYPPAEGTAEARSRAPAPTWPNGSAGWMARRPIVIRLQGRRPDDPRIEPGRCRRLRSSASESCPRRLPDAGLGRGRRGRGAGRLPALARCRP
jgi:NADH dehydrogenase